MLLIDEKNQQVNVDDLKQQIKNDIGAVKVPAQNELEGDLGTYYDQARTQDLKKYALAVTPLAAPDGKSLASLHGLGKKILEAIRKFVCKVLKPTSTIDDIIQAILDAIASIIPGGVVIKGIIEKIVKYLVDQGVTAFCKVVAP